MRECDVLILGAGAAGLMCAIEAGRRGRRVLVLDHANKAGKKILMSGGGRCNFTNRQISADNYISHNPHFCKSALSRYTNFDFIALVERYRIPYHEREHGRLFCNDSAKDILHMLLDECAEHAVGMELNTDIRAIEQRPDGGFIVRTSRSDAHSEIRCESLVIATGGLSIPRMGATPFGYQVAQQFDISVHPTRAGLVPFTLQPADKETLAPLSGIAVDARVCNGRQSFHENLLFTHRGLSGPAILQISSYWQAGEPIDIDLLPACDLATELQQAEHEKRQLKTWLAQRLPKRLIQTRLDPQLASTPVQRLREAQVQEAAASLQRWQIRPNGTEGYRTAEVTLGGVDCNALSSKTMESRAVPGLYFIGEVVDVTGWLGGYNFQWAWSSGWCAGQYA